MSKEFKSIIVNPESGFGDAFMATRVLKALCLAFPEKEIGIFANKIKSQLFEGILKSNGGFEYFNTGIDRIITPEYNTQPNELVLDLRGYLDKNPSLLGTKYHDIIMDITEEQLKDNGLERKLRKDIDSEVRFGNVKRFRPAIQRADKKIRQMKEKSGNKPIIWIATTSSGSKNRMPQSYEPNKDFWDELTDKLKDRFCFYELRGPDNFAINDAVEPKQGEFHDFPEQSHIIKQCTAGIGLDSMSPQLAYASGNRKMIILLGPTHPNTIKLPDNGLQVITIPDINSFNSSSYCKACGMVGYSTPKSYQGKKEIMQQRFPGFEFDQQTQEALKNNNTHDLNQAIMCRQLKPREQSYDCWKAVKIDEVIERLESLVL